MTRLFNFQAGRRSVLVTMVVQPFKFIVHSRDSRRVISFLLMLAGDVETNPGPLGNVITTLVCEPLLPL